MSSFLGGGGGGRTVLQAATNYYVSVTGSDSHGGTNPTTDAWATIQHAMDFISENLDTGSNLVTVNIGAGTFSGVGVRNVFGGGSVLFIGAGSGSTTIVNGDNDGVFNFGAPFCCNVEAQGFILYLNGATLNFDFSTGGGDLGVISLLDACTLLLSNFAGNTDLILTCSNAVSFVSYIYLEYQAFVLIGFSPGTLTIKASGQTMDSVIQAFGDAFVYGADDWAITGVKDTYVRGLINLDTQCAHYLNAVTLSGVGWTGPLFKAINGSSLVNIGNTTVFTGTQPPIWDASSHYNGAYGPAAVNFQTGNYTLAFTDAQNIVEINDAAANTVTVPLNSTVLFPVGTKITVVQQGAGATTIAAAAGVTVHNAGALTGQYASAVLYKRATDEWIQFNGAF